MSNHWNKDFRAARRPRPRPAESHVTKAAVMGQSCSVSSRLFWFAISNITQSNAGANWRLFCCDIQMPESFSSDMFQLSARLLQGFFNEKGFFVDREHFLPTCHDKHDLVAHFLLIFVVSHCGLIETINPTDCTRARITVQCTWVPIWAGYVSVIAAQYLPCPLKTGSLHWLRSSISPHTLGSHETWVGRVWISLSDVSTCQPPHPRTGLWTLMTDNVTSFVPNQSRRQTQRQRSTDSDCALPGLNPCQYSCVCGMIPHFPVAPAGCTWLLVSPIQCWVPSVMFWLTSMSRRSSEYQVPVPDQVSTNDRARCQAPHVTPCHTQTLTALVSSLRNFPSCQWYNFPLVLSLLQDLARTYSAGKKLSGSCLTTKDG